MSIPFKEKTSKATNLMGLLMPGMNKMCHTSSFNSNLFSISNTIPHILCLSFQQWLMRVAHYAVAGVADITLVRVRGQAAVEFLRDFMVSSEHIWLATKVHERKKRMTSKFLTGIPSQYESFAFFTSCRVRPWGPG